MLTRDVDSVSPMNYLPRFRIQEQPAGEDCLPIPIPFVESLAAEIERGDAVGQPLLVDEGVGAQGVYWALIRSHAFLFAIDVGLDRIEAHRLPFGPVRKFQYAEAAAHFHSALEVEHAVELGRLGALEVPVTVHEELVRARP